MPEEPPARIPVVFYRTEGGAEVVLAWIKSLEPIDQKAIGLELMRVQYRWPVGMPLCRPMGQGLWEFRVTLPSRRLARLLLSIRQGKILVLHGFIKKTQKTPDEELKLARRRDREFDEGLDDG